MPETSIHSSLFHRNGAVADAKIAATGKCFRVSLVIRNHQADAHKMIGPELVETESVALEWVHREAARFGFYSIGDFNLRVNT